MKITIDASVFVASARPEEPHYAISLDFLREARSREMKLICPSLVLPECGAAIARHLGDAVMAYTLVTQVAAWPGLELVHLTEDRARHAAQCAIRAQLRGADSIYVATALEFNAALISLDDEVLRRSISFVAGMTPSEWLGINP